MGGPGCGKETQCKNMATKYGFCHVGLGQLLWQEAQQGTRRGQKIHDIMLQGLLVPTVRAPFTCAWVGRAPNLVIVFDGSVEAMVQRELERRGQVECRADDCKWAIRQRLEVRYTLCQPTLAFYQQKNLLRSLSTPCLLLTPLAPQGSKSS
ncbi:LOW QUALITY PROTEIN: adenylate kinase isoenzyme 1-like [Balaenoptera musculus]|uniref:LOW QUALITY PROTEIN: adenylate kinase isoenzyme 1-like n=1 Tax=Balaenoptera musculus TaxID=9771 RepID=A0A8B8X1A5_BALMU|nr:LOW QUALITY PROTEIN: adenylate kinase isoenzyme 1-like [Balaenoptera musculus]